MPYIAIRKYFAWKAFSFAAETVHLNGCWKIGNEEKEKIICNRMHMMCIKLLYICKKIN